MFGLVANFIYEAASNGRLAYPAIVAVVALLLFTISTINLQRVVAREESDRRFFISAHIFVLLLPPPILFLFVEGPNNALIVAVLLSFFVPLAFQEGGLEKLLTKVYRDDALSPEGTRPVGSRSERPPASGPFPVRGASARKGPETKPVDNSTNTGT
jgi:hypothetical protein